MADNQPIFNELLCFLKDSRDSVPSNDLAEIAAKSFSREDINKAADVYIGLRPVSPSAVRDGGVKERRCASHSPSERIKKILGFMHEDAADIPMFVVEKPSNLPPVSLKSIDGVYLSRKMLQLTGEVIELKQAVHEAPDQELKTRLLGCENQLSTVIGFCLNLDRSLKTLQESVDSVIQTQNTRCKCIAVPVNAHQRMQDKQTVPNLQLASGLGLSESRTKDRDESESGGNGTAPGHNRTTARDGHSGSTATSGSGRTGTPSSLDSERHPSRQERTIRPHHTQNDCPAEHISASVNERSSLSDKPPTDQHPANSWAMVASMKDQLSEYRRKHRREYENRLAREASPAQTSAHQQPEGRARQQEPQQRGIQRQPATGGCRRRKQRPRKQQQRQQQQRSVQSSSDQQSDARASHSSSGISSTDISGGILAAPGNGGAQRVMGAQTEGSFVDVSKQRQARYQRKLQSSKRPLRGTGQHVNTDLKLSKLFISLPYGNESIDSVRRMISRITDSSVKCLKRKSISGYTSPFEIYGPKTVLLSIASPERWEKGTNIQLKDRNFKIPSDYYETSAEAERTNNNIS